MSEERIDPAALIVVAAPKRDRMIDGCLRGRPPWTLELPAIGGLASHDHHHKGDFMRARIGIAVAAVVMCVGGAEAQKPGRFGIGVSISPTLIIADEPFPPLTSFSFPMNFGGTFRLEPELGFGNANIEESDPFSGDFEASYSTLTIGVGAYFLFSRGDGFLLYAGPRIGMQRQSETFKFTGQPEDKMTRTDTFFGVGLGGEHFFSSHLSLGAEARFTHLSLGKPKIEPSGGPEPDFKASGNGTDGVVFVRFYF